MPVGFDLDEVTITTTDGEARTLSVWIADSAEDRARGLMEVTDLGDADGMLFVFESEGLHRFYMWQTPMPLDIAFFAADGTFVASAAMEPCLEPSAASCERYAPDEPFLLALEVPAGTLDDLGVGPGANSPATEPSDARLSPMQHRATCGASMIEVAERKWPPSPKTRGPLAREDCRRRSSPPISSPRSSDASAIRAAPPAASKAEATIARTPVELPVWGSCPCGVGGSGDRAAGWRTQPSPAGSSRSPSPSG